MLRPWARFTAKQTWGWTAFVGGWTTGLAYAAATLFYQLGTFAQHPAQSVFWVGAIAIAFGLTILGLKVARPGRSLRKESGMHQAH